MIYVIDNGSYGEERIYKSKRDVIDWAKYYRKFLEDWDFPEPESYSDAVELLGKYHQTVTEIESDSKNLV